MNADQLREEIRETNLAYLMLAQHMLRADRAEALYRLGIDEEIAEALASLTPAQLLRLASSSTLVCRMRSDDRLLWNLLAGHARTGSVASALHASILAAGAAAPAAA